VRQIILDTETTGLEPEQGHRIIEIGCIEVVNRRPSGRTFHRYINPERDIDDGAVDVHGLTTEFLADKPVFGDIVAEFLEFVSDAELVIHNAPFDLGFINAELARLEQGTVETFCQVLDTLALARRRHPGQRNSLDALCKRYEVDNSRRELHGALLDAQLLAEVYLAMTGGQAALSLGNKKRGSSPTDTSHKPLKRDGLRLRVLAASADELAAHEQLLDALEQDTGSCVWRAEAAQPAE
jgi:DNA polymerase-3 subunit epsilon